MVPSALYTKAVLGAKAPEMAFTMTIAAKNTPGNNSICMWQKATRASYKMAFFGTVLPGSVLACVKFRPVPQFASFFHFSLCSSIKGQRGNHNSCWCSSSAINCDEKQSVSRKSRAKIVLHLLLAQFDREAWAFGVCSLWTPPWATVAQLFFVNLRVRECRACLCQTAVYV